MGLLGFYGGPLPVVMINSIISQLETLARFIHDLITLILLGKASIRHGDGGMAQENMWAPTDELDPRSEFSIIDPIQRIMQEIRGSLSSSSFDPSSEAFLCKGCAVCLSEFEVGESVAELPRCCHVFHKGCLGRWLDRLQTTCPLCRSSLLTEELSRKLKDQEGEVAVEQWWYGSYTLNRLY